jgi:FtsH-binding integral membrane protein
MAFVVMCVVVWSKEAARKVPNNYVLLTFFTLCFSYMVTYFTCRYNPEIVIMAIIFTIAATVASVLYTFTVKDAEVKYCMLICIVIPVLLIVSIVFAASG